MTDQGETEGLEGGQEVEEGGASPAGADIIRGAPVRLAMPL